MALRQDAALAGIPRAEPAGRVPALELDGRAIWETGAITEVLCERFPDTGMGRAPDDPERIDWLIWVHFAETLSQHIATLTQQHIVLREDHMRSPGLMKIEAKRAEKCYEAIAARLRGGTTCSMAGSRRRM
jgi:glutathione S-transferase